MTEFWFLGAMALLTIATVELYIVWRIRRAANRMRAAHRAEDCSACLVKTLKSQEQAENVIRLVDIDSNREQ